LTGGGWAYCNNDSCKCMTGRIFDTIVNSCKCSLDARNQEQSGCRKKIAGIDELEPCKRLNCGENGKCVGKLGVVCDCDDGYSGEYCEVFSQSDENPTIKPVTQRPITQKPDNKKPDTRKPYTAEPEFIKLLTDDYVITSIVGFAILILIVICIYYCKIKNSSNPERQNSNETQPLNNRNRDIPMR